MILIGIYFIRNRKYELQVDVLMSVGQILIAVNSFYYGALPPAFLNVVGALINLNNIKTDLRRRKNNG